MNVKISLTLSKKFRRSIFHLFKKTGDMSMAAAEDVSTPQYAIHATFMMATTW
jgi:hypothetical protein